MEWSSSSSASSDWTSHSFRSDPLIPPVRRVLVQLLWLRPSPFTCYPRELLPTCSLSSSFGCHSCCEAVLPPESLFSSSSQESQQLRFFILLCPVANEAGWLERANRWRWVCFPLVQRRPCIDGALFLPAFHTRILLAQNSTRAVWLICASH